MRALGLGILGVCMGLVGCGPDHRAQCEAQMQCIGGNEKDVDACVALLDEYRDFYDDLGCGDEYDEFAICAEEVSKCVTNPVGQSCATSADCTNDLTCKDGQCVSSVYMVDPDKSDLCEVEVAAYSRCVQF